MNQEQYVSVGSCPPSSSEQLEPNCSSKVLSDIMNQYKQKFHGDASNEASRAMKPHVVALDPLGSPVPSQGQDRARARCSAQEQDRADARCSASKTRAM